jgi:hypothetical protein
VGELRLILQLLQSKHLQIKQFTIETVFKDQGTLSTKDFMMAGPTLWRLLSIFESVSLAFRHEVGPMPKPGKGPKGLSAFFKKERINLASFTAHAEIDETGGLDKWKWSYEHIFDPFLKHIMVKSCKTVIQVSDPTSEATDEERQQLYDSVDLFPIWVAFDASFKNSDTAVDVMWEWEHGSIAPKKAPAPGWSKNRVKA